MNQATAQNQGTQHQGTLTQEDKQRIEEHLPLVRHVVFQVAANFPRHVDREELARAGALGLIEAARRFEADRGVPFKRFAAQRIRGAILDSVRAADWAPRALRTAAREIESTRHELTCRMGRGPTDQEIASEIGVSVSWIADVQGRISRTVVMALDDQLAHADDEDLTLVDVLRDQDALDASEELESRELRAYLRDAIELLPERHRFVVVGYFLDGRTSDAIARFLDVTESRVSQMRTEALQMLRDGIAAQYADVHAEDAPAAPPRGTGRAARRQASYAAAIGSRRDCRSRLDEYVLVDLTEVPVH